MNIKNIIKKLLGRETQAMYKKNAFFEFIKPDFVFDVGANVGGSGIEYISSGFTNPIYSFEPVSHLFDKLKNASKDHENWTAFNIGIGDKKETLKINVSGGHGGASSFLKMTSGFLSIAPDQAIIKEESVDVLTLDEFYSSNNIDAKRIFLKIDVQGFEMNVLKGAEMLLKSNIIGLKIETSIVKQYVDEVDIFDVLPFLLERDFAVHSIVPGWRNPITKELLQVDIYLFRKSLMN